MRNIRDVSALGVTCVYTPEGETGPIHKDLMKSLYGHSAWFHVMS